MRYLLISLSVGTALLLHTDPAQAHLVSTRFGEFYSGILHPLTTLQHLVPWLALGLLGGLQQPETGRWALLAFPLAILVGLGLAALAPGITLVDELTVSSFVLIGVLVALAYRAGMITLLTLVIGLGVVHGYANAALLVGVPWVLYAAGVAVSAYALIALTAGSTQALIAGHDWGTVAVRAAGSWVAAAGLMYLTSLWFFAL